MSYYPPNTPIKIIAAVRMAQASGQCIICKQPLSEGMGGATCKSTECMRLWMWGSKNSAAREALEYEKAHTSMDDEVTHATNENH